MEGLVDLVFRFLEFDTEEEIKWKIMRWDEFVVFFLNFSLELEHRV